MTLAALLTLAGMQLAIAASPGPATVLAIRTSASRGLREGLMFSTGLAFAIVLWASAALGGLSLIFALAPWLQTGLRIVGAVFLIWVGISLWRGAGQPMPQDGGGRVPRSAASLFRLGLWTNLANPKALAYFTAVFTGLMPTDPTFGLIALLLAVVFAVEFAWYALVVLVFARPAAQRVYARVKLWTDRVFGALIAGAGGRIALG